MELDNTIYKSRQRTNAIGLTLSMGAMVLGRLTNDRWVDRWGATRVVRAGAVLCVLTLLTQHFDIVVTDQNMPDFSGVEVANILRTRGVDLPIVLSTGLISEELRKAAKEAGICEVFPKERSFEDLATLLIECLARSPRAGAASQQ